MLYRITYDYSHVKVKTSNWPEIKIHSLPIVIGFNGAENANYFIQRGMTRDDFNAPIIDTINKDEIQILCDYI